MIIDRAGTIKKALLDCGLNGNSSVLDVGCGSGEISFFLAGHCIKATGIDSENHIIRDARAGYKRKNLNFRTGRGEKLDFPDSVFDFVLFCQSLHHIPVSCQVLALNEAWRVLVQQGLLMVIEPVYMKGSFEKIASICNDERDVRHHAIKAVCSVIGNRFILLNKKEITIENSCTDFHDLYRNYIKLKPYSDWQDAYREDIASILNGCDMSPDGEMILDYYATVWLLGKT